MTGRVRQQHVPLVIAVDIGTTAVKVGAYDERGRELAVASRHYPLDSPRPGWAEQDADEVVDAAFDAVGEIVATIDGRVTGLSCCSAMHSLVGLDRSGSTVTPLVTYADTRAQPQAEELRREHLGVYRRTGTPLHPMSPLAKLRWFRESEPAGIEDVAVWCSVKELLVRRLTGALVVDHATASATGLFDLATQTWDPAALELAGITSAELGEIVPTTHVVPRLRADAAERVGLPPATPLVVGATDGVLATLGVGAAGSLGALTIGTSGAIRVTVDEPTTDAAMRVFCYALTTDRWVVGGAISTGGLLLDWLRERLFADAVDHHQMDAMAAAVPAGSDGVLVLPHLSGERAPVWSAAPTGVVYGLHRSHDRRHVVRAAMEGVAHQLRLVLDALADLGHRPERLRASGGFTQSSQWPRIAADVLDTPIEQVATTQATAFGAALLGMVALGVLDDLDTAAGLVTVGARLDPDPATRDAYDAAHARYVELADVLAGPFERHAQQRWEVGAVGPGAARPALK